VNTSLRQYDFYASQRVDQFVSNSQEVARRIAKFYGQTAQVIHPPVRVWGQGEAGDQYYLYMGRLAPGKQVDLAIQACSRLNRPLWIVGTGSEEARLRAMAGPNVRFLGFMLPEAMTDIYANAKALIFSCANEAFGIVPVEAMGHGIPVIAFEQSGVRESVLAYKTGLFFRQPTVDSLCVAIEEFESLHFSSQACIERAQDFSEPIFIAKLQQFIAQSLDKHQQQFIVQPLEQAQFLEKHTA
jgi:glycosyltransferase involved in cell wall biosynthesis